MLTFSKNPKPLRSKLVMQSLRSCILRVPLNPKSFNVIVSSFCSISQPSISLVDYLITTLNFPKPKAIAVASRFSRRKSPPQPYSVVEYLQSLGFSNTHIESAARLCPQILFTNIDKTLKPKIEFLQKLGLVGTDLANFILKSSPILTQSLEKRLIPCVQILKKILLDDKDNKYLFRVMSGSHWAIGNVDTMLKNIALLETYGIVGNQLSSLLKRQPRIFVGTESHLNRIVSRALDMGFSPGSKSFSHALVTVIGISDETSERKIKFLMSYGFSRDECMEMFRRAPALLRTSEKKLKLNLEFFLFTVKFRKIVLLRRPAVLMNCFEDRVVARYKVLQIMKSKRLLKKEPSFMNTLFLTEEEFMEKYISNFRDHAEELLLAYRGHLLDSY